MTTILAQVERLTVPEIDYGAVAPVLVILGAACVSVLLEAFLPKQSRWPAQVVLTVLALAGAAGALIVHGGAADTVDRGVVTFSGAIAVDPPVVFLWGTLLLLAVGSLLLIADRSVEPGGAFAPEPQAGGQGGGGGAVATRARAVASVMQTEVFPLTLFALGGMMVFVAANDLLTMFIALEVLSLPLYLLCGLGRRRRLLSQEAAVKYFLLGAFASAFFLYGVALLYGYSGSVKLVDIAAATAATDRSDTLLYAGFGLLVVGLLFKASVGPFHAWTPDVYQGAPTPVTAFMAACTKVAAFGGILRVLHVAFQGSSWEWNVVLAVLAGVSMVIGAVLGLTQTDVKRMIAYSSVAHAGFLLVGAIALTPEGLSATMFYLAAYGFTTIAAFGVVSLVRNADGEATHLSQWAGLAKRSPITAAVFTLLLLALAGIPFTSGFIGKFVVFAAAIDAGMAPLVVFALVVSAIAAFFYLRVIVLMYFSEPAADGPTVTVPGAFTTASITLGAVITLVLGVWPAFALDWAGSGQFIF
ncbi:NADH-quinone oxidoreductase subunit NuoN [Actinosynnema pretiosum subsp. pretiosum]|uniref:NADH-quinone oxidoreductase subunit N n=2 Tax=Actinosynnema TaxID=40566 RepID=C6WNA2_ACTMD|nr:NADH-quinone oxidoreductase subunit NuoN [Actinosynnema mirum]ACU40466.1 proton-translocating NADH-quinone oxidoreductase, chain N [Actinosynnema mirum DSM 43827]AXX33980.1 NADH-ubiquinone oxidoreductase chain N [Actinosynnema pretiosum subsp. pretiosum]QUF02276.1 NADH-quinone oxidoreductase subunit NuoN [Actinosynnema pretiosum subsp. pretiosum]